MKKVAVLALLLLLAAALLTNLGLESYRGPGFVHISTNPDGTVLVSNTSYDFSSTATRKTGEEYLYCSDISNTQILQAELVEIEVTYSYGRDELFTYVETGNTKVVSMLADTSTESHYSGGHNRIGFDTGLTGYELDGSMQQVYSPDELGNYTNTTTGFFLDAAATCAQKPFGRLQRLYAGTKNMIETNYHNYKINNP